jgi:hypothetical protein
MDISKRTISENEVEINLYITGTATYNCPDSGGDSETAYFDSFRFLYKLKGNYTTLNPITSPSHTPRIYD